MKPLNFDRAIAQHFDRAAVSYAQHDEIQRQAAQDLYSDSMSVLSPSIGTLADIGCGPAAETATLKNHCQQYIGVDISREMLIQGRTSHPNLNWLQGHWTELPLLNNSINWVFANLSLQWVDNLHKALAEIHRVLQPGGVATVNTLLPNTFLSLQSSWSQIDNQPHVNRFFALPDIRNLVETLPWQHQALYTHNHTQYFCDLRALLTSIKGVGASVVKRETSSGLMTKSKFQTLENAYEVYRTDKGLPLEWRILNIILVKQD